MFVGIGCGRGILGFDVGRGRRMERGNIGFVVRVGV